MTAGTWNITIEQGADLSLPLLFTDASDNPVDLTGWSAEMMIRTSANDPNPLITLSTEGGGIILGGTAGTIVITIDEATTQQFNAEAAVYDLRMQDSLGKHLRLIQGQVNISPAITR